MSQNVFITGTGRKMGLGYNFVLRYLENGDNVIATIRKPSPELEELKEKYPNTLHILTMDISSTESVEKAIKEAEAIVPCVDLLINNAVTASVDCAKEFADTNLDYIPETVNVASVGPMRVIKAILPLLKKSEGMSFIANISSEAGSIGKCYRTSMIDYSMAKTALNMGTMLIKNVLKDEPKVNIKCIHPGWMRTNEDNLHATYDPYDSAEIMRKLFEEQREDKEGPTFITYTGEEYPW